MNWVLDMDDTLAHFHEQKNALERFATEKDFFSNLQPTQLTKYIKRLLQSNILKPEQVYIISASPNTQADKDKRDWLDKHLQEIPKKNILFSRLGEDKGDHFIKAHNLKQKDLENYILFDDYTKNLLDWKNKGGKVLKVINEYNNTRQSYKQHKINTLDFNFLN